MKRSCLSAQKTSPGSLIAMQAMNGCITRALIRGRPLCGQLRRFFEIARAFALARFAFSIQAATSSASFVRRRESQAFGAAILPLPAGTLTQLEKFQKRLNVLGRTLGHTPSLGVFCWLEVTDFDRFSGSLFLVLHVCCSSLAIR